MHKKFSIIKNYAKFIGVSEIQERRYRNSTSRKYGKNYIQYIPLKLLKKSYLYLDEDLRDKIEKNIIAIRCRAGKPLKNPKLPIKESPELYRIAGHMLGDGSATKSKTPYYSNKGKELREQFKRDLRIFGNVEPYDRKQTVPVVFFQKTVTDIISHILSISFNNKEKIPITIFSAPDHCKSAFLQALFDDEGTTSTNLRIGMNNLNIVKEIKRLVESLNIKTGKISVVKSHHGGTCYYFSISEDYIKKFKDKIGFNHPIKLNRLNTKIKIKERSRVQRTRPLEWTRKEILRLLKIRPMKTLDLCEKLLLSVSGVYHHLRYLKTNKKILRTGYKNNALWKLRS